MVISFVFIAFGSITKGTEMQQPCLWFLIQYSKGDMTIFLDRD